jgi:hypothetical protein
MLVSLFTVIVGLVLIYFLWGAIDPNTVQDLESKWSRGSSVSSESSRGARTRNLVCAVITGTMFLTGLYYDLVRKTPVIEAAPESASQRPADGDVVNREVTDRIDAAMLEKEVGRRRAVFADRNP